MFCKITCLLFLACSLSTAAVVTNSPLLPPNVGGYVSASDVHACYPVCPNIDLNNIAHKFFLNIVRNPIGPNEFEMFDSTATGNVSVGGGPFNPITLTGPVQTVVFNKVGNTTGVFNTEMLALNLSGGGVMLRESPTLASTGVTSITDVGGGNFQIDSFFDIFTELYAGTLPGYVGCDTWYHDAQHSLDCTKRIFRTHPVCKGCNVVA